MDGSEKDQFTRWIANTMCCEEGEKTKKMIQKEELTNKEEKKNEKKAEVPVKKVKQEKAFDIPELKDESISSEAWENHLQWEKSVNCRQVLEALASTLEEPSRRRKPQLTKTQVWPYVGNSTVKRIITGKKLLKEPYHPLAKVEAEKLLKVLDFIKSDLEAKEPGSRDESAGFYLKLVIPRDAWPTKNYGWLHDSHIAAAMLMFHRRSRQEQSPYSSSRIAFLSHWFVNSWVNDYKKWDQNMSELSEMYSKAFNGEHPADLVTEKKWFVDVDDLFLCHNVNGDHWVAVRIDLRKEGIHVYDSICTHLSDKQMKEECRPFMRMLPAVLNKMLPAKMRTKREKQFSYIRHKKIPQNENLGDCGVYSLMYIECLALGLNFEGLSDQILASLRQKLAADIYEEVYEKAK